MESSPSSTPLFDPSAVASKRRRLVEWLARIAVVAILAAAGAVVVSSARSKERDTIRLTQVRQVQSALWDYFLQWNRYPAGPATLGSAEARCLDSTGFQSNCEGSSSDIFMARLLPLSSKGLSRIPACGGSCYTSAPDANSYSIEFSLEHDWAPLELTAGLNCALPEGMVSGPCGAL